MATERPAWPQTPSDWRNATEAGLGLSESEGRAALANDTFPYDRVAAWIPERWGPPVCVPQFSEFVLNNLRGMVAWAYGSGSQPNWRRTDETQSDAD